MAIAQEKLNTLFKYERAMAEGIYITKTDFNQLMKKVSFMEEYIKNSLKQQGKSKWVTPQEAMELIGCKETKLKELRLSGELEWKTLGKGRGVMILRKSIEAYNDKNSSTLKRA